MLASEMTKSRKHLVVKSIDFDQFMASEGTKTLILAFTAKTGKSVRAYQAQNIFIGIFFVKERIY